jgi:hypothetical protein
MKISAGICHLMLIVAVALSINWDYQIGNAYGDDDSDGYSGDSPFSLPFDSGIAGDSDGDDDDGDYESGDELPFP